MHKQSVLRVILLFVFILTCWTGYRYFFALPEWVDEFIAKPLIYLLPILISKNTLTSLGITKNKFWLYVLMGSGIGALLLFESVMVRFFKYGPVQVRTLAPQVFLLNLCIVLATAFTEEIVFRGYFFRRFMWVWHNEVIANVLSTVFFTISHLPIAIFSFHYQGGQLFAYCAQVYVLGTIFAYIFARTKNIVPTTVAHAIWNFSNVFIK